MVVPDQRVAGKASEAPGLLCLESGEQDVGGGCSQQYACVTDGTQVVAVHNGVPMLTLVTAAGESWAA
eukprot:scaffold145460_cov18-Tisochrysis_lutea.AAC.1